MSFVSLEVLESRLRNPSVKEQVKRLCKERPCVKGDYRLLLYYFWRQSGIKVSLKEFDEIRRLPSPETIGRRFRELKEENPSEFSASLETEEKRRVNQLAFKRYYAGKISSWC